MNALDVKKIRSELSISQDELAEMLGISLRTVQNWEAGKVIPKSKHAILHNLINHSEIKADLSDQVVMSREVFEQITKMTETILSQQETIKNLSKKIK